MAGKLASVGKKVALVEQSDKMYGGTCINVGCIPSKSLVHHGITGKAKDLQTFQGKQDWYKKAVQEKKQLVEGLRQKNYAKLNQLPTVTIINGKASFLSEYQIEVLNGTDKKTLEADKIYINTGATQIQPRIEGIQENPFVYNSETLMNLEELPEHLSIIGGGYIGLEFASMYAEFGAKVTVFQDGETFVGREDRDIAEAIKEILEAKGVQFILGVSIEKVIAEEKQAVIQYNRQGEICHQQAEAVLIATGRKANTEGLQVEKAGIELTERGAIKVNEKMQTNIPHIFAMGDVTGGLQFTYTSLDDYRIIWSQLQGENYTLEKRRNVPYSVFLTPAYSRVGLNETEAEKAGYEVKIMKMPAAMIPKAQVLQNTQGLLKAVVDRKTNKILGAMLLCEESYEMINLIKLAMDMDADYTVLRDQIFTHPTMSEALNDLFSL